jgi:hypothetical protein
MGGNI